MRFFHHKYAAGMSAVLLAVVFMATGCRIGLSEFGNTKIVLTTGFDKDEVFRIDRMSCRLPEVMVYLTNTKKPVRTGAWQPDLADLL